MHLPSDAIASPNPLNYQEFGNMGVISNYSTRSSHKDPWWDQFGHPEATKGSPSTIVAMFEDAVARHPHRTAVEDEQKCQLTFLQLNGIANRLARVLFRTRGDIIPVCMDRSIDLLVTLLAVLKIGAAYTILDPDGPAERNAQIFHDSGASVILTQQRYMHIFDNALNIEQALLQATAGSNDNNLDIPIHSKDKCYIIYTSGSTGRPKGVVLTHGAASTGMAYHSLNGCDRWLLFYNPTFSAAQRTMLSTLIHGGTLIVASKEKVQTELAHLINDLSIDALGLTPSALSILHPSQVPNLRQVTLIGERIPELLVSQWAPHLELRNSYGLSECTQLNFGTRLQPGSNPRAIGRPIDTTSAFVLDPESTQLMPHGMPGELCLVGPQLGSGYLNNIQATDKVFIPNPFGKGKLYRTGDSARMTPDGSFEILGRIDFQVKINGQKVDPTEVDAALIKHPAVTASITVGASISDRTILVTGIVLGEDSQWTTVRSTLRQHAESFLPAYMVPSFWMPLAEVPRNSNGKLDLLHFKRTVESMTIDQLLGTTNASDDDDPVVDPVEIQIAQIWAEVLGMQLSSIRRQHSFVMLGGSSIQAITTIAKLATIGLQTNLRSLLGDTTLMTAASLYEKTEVSLKDPEPFSLISDVQLRKGLQSDDAIVDAYPATPLQQDLLASLAMDDDCYTYQRLWDVSDLDVPRLRASFHAVFEQSDILRTSFVPNGNTIIQVVKSDLGFPWFESSLTLEEYCRQSRTSPLTLSGPLFRIALVSGSTLVISMHHSLFDLWSHQFLYQDVAAIYHGKKPEIRAPFKRFINYLSNQDWDAKHEFWKHYLSGSEPTKLNHSPSEHTTKLSTTLPYSWKSQVRAHNLTMGAVFYTAWAVVLSKHTASYDVGFLTSLSGRDAPVPGVQTMDGPTLSMVPQRVLIDPLRSIVELVKDVGSRAMELNDHVQYGLRNALAAGSLRIDDFDTFLNILVSPEVDEVTASVFKRHGPPPHWDSSFTTLEVVDNEDSTTIRICGKMESLRLQYLLDSFIIAVKSIIQYPTHTVASIDIIGDAEGEYLKNVLSNCATLRGPTWQLLHARFEAHAKHCPNAIAIDWDATEELTYAALDSRANQLSHHLFDRGVRVGDIIPLMVDKSIDTIIAILGVLKTGAAYVPLTADNPMERNSFILRDVGAKLMIVHKKYADFGACNDIAVVVIDDIPWEDIKVPAPESSVTPDYLAYVIYTSGSTGQPKGVKVSHRAAASAVTSMEVAEGRNNGEWRTLQFANYVFDASVQDIFNTLSTGGTLCMAPTETLLSDLPGAINALHVKQAIITPTVAKLITPVEVPTLQTLIVGGEPITRDIVESWATAGRQVLNVYGPTETSMVVTTKNVTPSSIVSNIGTPFSTVVAFVLEPESVRLVPYGGIGELCIAGPQLSDGYVNRPDLSAAAFVDGTALGVSKLYRTGDLARWLPGREISCLGRKDSQVKIHGHRIELGEIEVAMTKQDKIQDAAVISIDIGGKPSLVAFCVLKSADKPSTSPTIWCPQDHIDEFSQLHQGLVSLGLTPYMIPNFVVPIGDLPKLPSRKVDRKALRRLVEDMDHSLLRQYILSSTGAKHNIVPVETSMEVELERLFSEILQLPTSEIGREANFMVLGGDSVMAIMLSSSMRKAGLLLSVKQILKLATLKDMAAVVQMVEDSDLKVEREFTIPEDVRRKVESEGLDWQQDVEYVYPCPPGQAEFAAQGARDEQMWTLTATRRMPQGTDRAAWLAGTMQLTQVNDILRTSWLCTESGEWVGVVLRSSQLDVVSMTCETEDDSNNMLQAFIAEPFLFGRPFTRYAILTYPDGSFDIAIKLNHAVYDGTLLRLFDDHFAAIRTGIPIPMHTPFRDYALHVYSSDKATSLEYWNQSLADIPTPYLNSVTKPRTTAVHRCIIPINLEMLAQSCGVTPSAIFQAAYQLWLAQTTDRLDVSFDYLLSGRNIAFSADPMCINGTLANFLPLRSPSVPHKASLRSYLEATQDAFWAATEHGNVGLTSIYENIGMDREIVGNRTLFLFQPFEPAPGEDDLRWLVMAKSRVHMVQPYALVVEVAKAKERGQHRLAVYYDGSVFEKRDVECIAAEVSTLVEKMVKNGGKAGFNMFLEK